MSLGRKILRNIVIDGRRTSMRQETAIWDALEDIAKREGITIDDLCGMIKSRYDERRRMKGLDGVGFASAVRVMVTSYYRIAATEEGHVGAGHGVRENLFYGTPLDGASEDDTGS